MPCEEEEVRSSWDSFFVLRYTDLWWPPHTEKESLVVIFDNVVIPKLKKNGEKYGGLFQKPHHTFRHISPRFHKSDPAGVDMTPVIGHGIGRINFPDIMVRLAKMQDRWSKR